MHTTLLRYHGSKYRLAPWILSHFPEHQVYVEPFAGAASVLLRKPRSHGEVYNDLDQEVFNLFCVLRDKESSNRLYELCQLTPYSRDEFKLAYQISHEPIERARRMIVRSAMGFSSGAANRHITGFRAGANRPSATVATSWSRYPDVIRWACHRLQGVNIENRPALDCIKSHDSANTLIYADPPYLKETRDIFYCDGVYSHEMSVNDHAELLSRLMQSKGMVVLSGYNSDLYNDTLVGWRKVEKQARISAHKGQRMKTECLWVNPACEQGLLLLNDKKKNNIG